MIEPAIYRYLSENNNINTHSKGAYLFHIPQTAEYPCITYGVTGEQRQQSYDGPQKLVQALIEVNTFSKTYESARRLSDIIITELDSFSGDLFGVRVDQSNLSESIGFYEHATNLYGVQNEFTIFYR